MTSRNKAALTLAAALFAWPAYIVLADVVRSVPATSGGGGGGASLPVSDSTSIVEDNADGTKEMRFEVSAVTAGQTRVITVPDSNTTLPIASQVITWSGPTAARTITVDDAAQTLAARNRDNTFDAANIQTFNASEPADQSLPSSAPFIKVQNATDPTNNFFTISMYDGSGIGAYFILGGSEAIAGGGFHFLRDSSGLSEANAAQIYTDFCSRGNPCLAYKSAPTHGMYASSTEGVMGFVTGSNNTRMAMSRSHTTLTESAATTILEIRVADATGCVGDIDYSVWATDGTDHQVRSGKIRVAVVNKSATETCGMTNQAGTADASISETDDGSAVAVSSGTLTYAVTCDTTAAVANAVAIKINAVSSLTQTQLRSFWSASFSPGGGGSDSCAVVGF